ncbi:MAG: hypothetical protein DDT39_01514 [Firmicutes bacterium]|nr:hypothetical protein [candidate division NPL-UPA2 bacterium]
MLNYVRGDLIAHNVLRVSSSDLHGDIAAKSAKLVRLSNKISLTIHFHEHTYAAVTVDVGLNHTLASDTPGLFIGGR